MLLGGDELSRTQGGNNNAWCQDNEISWYDWTRAGGASGARVHPAADPPAARALHVPARELPARAEVNGSELPDVWWFRARRAQDDQPRLAARRGGAGHVPQRRRRSSTPGPHGEEVEDDSFVLLFNAHAEDREFKLPRRRMGARWELELCTADPDAEAGQRRL